MDRKANRRRSRSGSALVCVLLPWMAAASDPPRQKAGPYQVTLRLPADGLYAQEEMQIEFRIEDTTRPDPLTVYTPVIRATPEATIDMPAMRGMPPFSEIAHAEGAPGDYGIHPTFAHGGEFRLRIAIEAGTVAEFPLTVMDRAAKRKRAPARYTLEVSSEPKRPKSGEPVELRAVVRDRERNAAVTEFDVMHEKLLHLILVRRDLAYFAHEHPALGTDGVFRLRYTFASGGEYRVFADTAPRAAGAQILSGTIAVAGKVEAETELPQDLVEVTSGAQVGAGKTAPVAIRIRDASQLEPYLGAAGHLILIHEDATTFVHSHPDDGPAASGKLVFQTRFPKAGVYHGWVQFQRAGKVETAALRFEAQ